MLLSYHWLSVTSLNSTQAQYHLFCSITWPMTSDLQAIYGKKHFWTPNLGHLDMELGCGCCGWGRNATIYKVPVEDIPESYVDFMTIFSMEGLKPRFFLGKKQLRYWLHPTGAGLRLSMLHQDVYQILRHEATAPSRLLDSWMEYQLGSNKGLQLILFSS